MTGTHPMNAAAEQIARANSNISDLTVQISELQRAMHRHLDLIEALTPVAEWGTLPETVEDPPAEELEE